MSRHRTGARLTETRIENAAPRSGTRYVLWDAEVRGFGVRIADDSKTFILKYRTPAGRVRWKTLGRVGGIKLDEARRLARIDVGILAEGDDPQAVRDAARAGSSLGDVAERFMADYVLVHKKPSTQRSYRQALDAFILPALRNVPIGDLARADAVRLHDRLRNTPTQANRVLATLSSLVSWAMDAGRYREPGPNPCVKIKKYPEVKRKRYLTANEYAKVGRALRSFTMSPGPRAAIELVILTGARPGEIATLKWAHVDVAGHALNLPDSKTGAKVIHLSPAAAKILRKWPRRVGSDYVFPGENTGEVPAAHMNPSTLSHLWADLRATIGLHDVRLYDAGRHSFASTAISNHGLSLAQIGAHLGHSQPATTQRYAHLHADVAKQQAAEVGGAIASALRRRVRR